MHGIIVVHILRSLRGCKFTLLSDNQPGKAMRRPLLAEIIEEEESDIVGVENREVAKSVKTALAVPQRTPSMKAPSLGETLGGGSRMDDGNNDDDDAIAQAAQRPASSVREYFG